MGSAQGAKTNTATQQSKPKNALFGAPLLTAIQRSAHLNAQQQDAKTVPIVVRRCCEYLNTSGKSVQGLYRIAGTKQKIHEYASRYDNGTQ